jgi:hypothetical protein
MFKKVVEGTFDIEKYEIEFTLKENKKKAKNLAIEIEEGYSESISLMTDEEPSEFLHVVKAVDPGDMKRRRFSKMHLKSIMIEKQGDKLEGDLVLNSVKSTHVSKNKWKTSKKPTPEPNFQESKEDEDSDQNSNTSDDSQDYEGSKLSSKKDISNTHRNSNLKPEKEPRGSKNLSSRPSVVNSPRDQINLEEMFKNKNLKIPELIEILFEAKCDDLQIVSGERKQRFIDTFNIMLEKREIDLSVGGLGMKSAKVLAKIFFEDFDVLKIDLRNNQFGDEGIKAIAKAVPFWKTVIDFRIGSTDADEEGLWSMFKNLEKNQSVSSLSLANTQNYKLKISPGAWDFFVNLMEMNKTISILNLSSNYISVQNSEFIDKAVLMNKGRLISLDLSNNQINSKCIELLKSVFISS